jgi:ligand-binding SRPBCC domain-containing protein
MITPLPIFVAALLTAAGPARASDQPAPELGKAPTWITMEVEIDAPMDVVWEEFSRIGDIYLSSPTVDRSQLSSEQAHGLGASRHMEMSIKEGATLDERVIAWEEGTYMALEVYRIVGVTGVQTMGGDFRLTPAGDRTVLTSTLDYSMTNGLFGFMNRAVMKRKFAGLWSSVLAGYKHHIETGEEVTATTRLDPDTVRLVSLEVGERGDEIGVDATTGASGAGLTLNR